MFGKLLIGFFAVIAALAIVGFLLRKREIMKNGAAPAQEDEILNQKTLDNVLDLRDRFNRARYMERDGD